MSAPIAFILVGNQVENALTSKINIFLRDVYSGWFAESHEFIFSITHKNQELKIDDGWDIYGDSSSFWLGFKKDINNKNKIMSEMFELGSNSIIKTTKFMDLIYKDFIDCNLNAIFSLSNMRVIQDKVVGDSVSAAKGSGAIIGNINNGSVSIPIAISGDLVRAICGEVNQKVHVPKPQINLVSRNSTLEKYKANIEVLAGEAKISLLDFSKMEVGDVVLLNKKVGEPFFVQSGNKVSVGSIQLGRLENKKAIQFLE